jgi:hypothetical protein
MQNSADVRPTDYSAATIVPADGATATLSDEECVRRLAAAIENHDADKFEEVAMLIGRLAVTIE